MEIPGYDPNNVQMVRRAISLLTGHHEIEVVRPDPPAPTLPPNKWREYLPPGPEAIAYAHSRGLDDVRIAKFRLGQYKHFLAIPSFEEGILKMIKFRNTWKAELLNERDFDHLRFWGAKGSRKSLFNYDAVAYITEPVLVLKGEIPVMLMDQYDIPACAPSTGESSYVDQWKHLLALSPKVVVVGDNDLNPKTRAEMQAKAAERAQALGADLRFPPDEWKDIDAWMLADPGAGEVIRSWLKRT